MVKINEFERTANFAWSHDTLPYLASASLAGAIDLDFSSSSKLEIFDVFKGKESLSSASLESKVYGLDWSRPTDKASKGIIAGALETGVVQLWDALKLLEGKNSEASTLVKGTKHSSHVKTVQFNPLQDHILASAGSKGEIFIWDTNKFEDVSSPGKAMTPMEEITSLSWNYNVKHVFASAGSTGYTSIWDLRAKKEVLHLTYTGSTGRCNLSVVTWNPLESTQLLTLSDEDNSPYILSWNLRNPKEPEKIMKGHKKGVLSLDWCRQDNELLLSSGKDNSTFLWDPVHGVKLGEYPTTANWTFETRFAPNLPDIFATSSFDGKIVVQSLQDTSPPAAVPTSTAADDANQEDFWGQLASTETQQPEFQVKKAPKWLKRPTSVRFGFGGSLVHVTQPDPKLNKSSITIGKFVSGSDITKDIKLLSESVASKDFSKIVSDKVSSSKDAAKADWQLLEKLLAKDKLELLKEQVGEQKETSDDSQEEKAESTPTNGSADDGFFENLGSKQDFLFEPPTESFKLFSEDDSATETKLKKLILAGKSLEAIDLCIEEDRITDALILALNSSAEIQEKVKNAYFNKAIPTSTVARVLYNLSSNDISDLVNHADISNWKQIASSISVFNTNEHEFNTKISQLGDRILESGSATARDDAMICYAAGNAIDKISNIWLKEVNDYEASLKKQDSITASEAHFKALSEFVEKITVYRAASGLASKEFSGPGIEKLCNTILEYSNIIANFGEFELANNFLELLPSSNEQLKIEKDRVSRALKKPSSTSTKATAATAAPGIAKKNLPYLKPNPYGSGAYAPPVVPGATTPSYSPVASNGYTPLASSGANPYAAVAASALQPQLIKPPSANPYAPTTALDSLRRPSEPGQSEVPPPPLPKTAMDGPGKDVGGWNDLPVHLGVKNARSTPTPSPYANIAATASIQQQQQQQQQQVPRPGMASRVSSLASLPPPPPPVASTQSVGDITSPKAPLAPKPSRYAPPPSLTASAVPPIAGSNGFDLTPPASASIPPANPYAPKLLPASNPYAPPPQASLPQTQAIHAPPPPPHASNGTRNNSYAPPPPASQFLPPSVVNSPSPAPALLQETPAKPRHPAGDRSHIPASQAPIFETLGSTLQQTASKMPEKYLKQVKDTEKRLNILFDLLNNEELSLDIVTKLLQVLNSIQSGDLSSASSLQGQVALDHPTECGQWMVGLKRLIQMTEAANR